MQCTRRRLSRVSSLNGQVWRNAMVRVVRRRRVKAVAAIAEGAISAQAWRTIVAPTSASARLEWSVGNLGQFGSCMLDPVRRGTRGDGSVVESFGVRASNDDDVLLAPRMTIEVRISVSQLGCSEPLGPPRRLSSTCRQPTDATRQRHLDDFRNETLDSSPLSS